MAQKLYKRQFTQQDLNLIQNYIAKRGGQLLIETWQDGSDDGDVYEIKPNNLAHAINITDKYYDNINSNKKVAELLYREPNGEYTCVYHTERNRSGITFEILGYAKACKDTNIYKITTLDEFFSKYKIDTSFLLVVANNKVFNLTKNIFNDTYSITPVKVSIEDIQFLKSLNDITQCLVISSKDVANLDKNIVGIIRHLSLDNLLDFYQTIFDKYCKNKDIYSYDYLFKVCLYIGYSLGSSPERWEIYKKLLCRGIDMDTFILSNCYSTDAIFLGRKYYEMCLPYEQKGISEEEYGKVISNSLGFKNWQWSEISYLISNLAGANGLKLWKIIFGLLKK